MKRFLPVQLDLEGRSALVVGADRSVAPKVATLVEVGAAVRVLVPPGAAVEPDIAAHAARGALRLERAEPTIADLDGAAIVFVATSEAARAAPLLEEARRRGLPLCTVDRPEASTFIAPAVGSAAGIDLTVSTRGASPTTAQKIRDALVRALEEPRVATYVAALSALRDRLPRGERGPRLAKAAEDFAVHVRVELPAWVDAGEP